MCHLLHMNNFILRLAQRPRGFKLEVRNQGSLNWGAPTSNVMGGTGDKKYGFHTGRSKNMKLGWRVMCLIAFSFALAVSGWGQTGSNHQTADSQKTEKPGKKTRGPGKEMGKGGEDIGKGVAKGTGDLGKGTAGGIGNLAHGNIGGAGASVGKGVGGLGKNVTVGTGKGLGKVGKGIGGEFKKLGRKSNAKKQAG